MHHLAALTHINENPESYIVVAGMCMYVLHSIDIEVKSPKYGLTLNKDARIFKQISRPKKVTWKWNKTSIVCIYTVFSLALRVTCSQRCQIATMLAKGQHLKLSSYNTKINSKKIAPQDYLINLWGSNTSVVDVFAFKGCICGSPVSSEGDFITQIMNFIVLTMQICTISINMDGKISRKDLTLITIKKIVVKRNVADFPL